MPVQCLEGNGGEQNQTLQVRNIFTSKVHYFSIRR